MVEDILRHFENDPEHGKIQKQPRHKAKEHYTKHSSSDAQITMLGYPIRT